MDFFIIYMSPVARDCYRIVHAIPRLNDKLFITSNVAAIVYNH